MRLLLTLTLLGTAHLTAITFDTNPADGAVQGAPSSTVGWGYSIFNDTAFYLLPLGLSNSGMNYGGLDDIFNYPVVTPGQLISQAYIFNTPGGFGNSLGLFEYLVPSDVPAGSQQTGTFTLTYQLFDDDPDLNPEAMPVGNSVALDASFQFEAADGSQVPEPATISMYALGLAGVVWWRYKRS